MRRCGQPLKDRTAANMTDAAVGITGELSAGNAAISERAAEDKSAGRIHEFFKVGIQPILRSRADHEVFDDGLEVLNVHIVCMLHGAEEHTKRQMLTAQTALP